MNFKISGACHELPRKTLTVARQRISQEAVTSRPRLLLAAVCKEAKRGGQTHLYLKPRHGKVQTIKALVANVRAALQHVTTIAEVFPKVDRWLTLLRNVCRRFAPTITTPMLQSTLAGSG